ncbi:MAG: hypothetical protein NZM43_08840 [Saprospiraceae bacterium]|nr:hypothetical protein [Saprospiraceae bacterium]MDW8484418.1 cytochrome c peroxidase [Saprospiraceae bacterium]
MTRFTLLLFVVAILAIACKREASIVIQGDPTDLLDKVALERALHSLDYDYTPSFPNYLKSAGLQPVPIDKKKAALGRVLFYDKILSHNQSLSCASCHEQSRAFADAKGFSMGVNGQKLERQSLPLANTANFAAHYRQLNDTGIPPFLWDGRTLSLDEISRMAITSPDEMNMSMEEVLERIRSKDYYQALWRRVFGHSSPKENEMLEALSEFVKAIGSVHASFDASMEMNAGNPNATVKADTSVSAFYHGPPNVIIVKDTTPPPGFTLSQFRGLRLFTRNCSGCHSAIRPFQQVFEACNGLSLIYKDQGKGKITGNPQDYGVFKAISLRNVALTAPYMHDGRFKTLTEVIDFYSTGIQPHPNLHPLLRNPDGSPKRFNFTAKEKQDLLNFLDMLTDKKLVEDVRFSNPFKQQ